jgi:hypothetical protein
LFKSLLQLAELFRIASDQYDGTGFATSNVVARPMPDVGPVMMYALCSAGLFMKEVLRIPATPLLSV